MLKEGDYKRDMPPKVGLFRKPSSIGTELGIVPGSSFLASV
jgi:hypothetical protein